MSLTLSTASFGLRLWTLTRRIAWDSGTVCRRSQGGRHSMSWRSISPWNSWSLDFRVSWVVSPNQAFQFKEFPKILPCAGWCWSTLSCHLADVAVLAMGGMVPLNPSTWFPLALRQVEKSGFNEGGAPDSDNFLALQFYLGGFGMFRPSTSLDLMICKPVPWDVSGKKNTLLETCHKNIKV